MDSKQLTHNAIQIEKLHKDGNYDAILVLLSDLSSSCVTAELLQLTDIVGVLYQLLKTCSNTTVKKTTKLLLCNWKKLYSSSYQISLKSSSESQVLMGEPHQRTSSGVVNRKRSSEGHLTSSTFGLDLIEGFQHGTGSGEQHPETQTSLLEHTEDRPDPEPVRRLSLTQSPLEVACSSETEENTIISASSPNRTGHGDSSTTSLRPPSPPRRDGDTALRDKCVHLLHQALSTEAETGPEQTARLTALAQDIETQIHGLHGANTVKYKACVRSRVANLRNPKSPHLRQGLATGSLAPRAFARMSAEEMAGSELRRLREGYTSSGISERQLPLPLEGTSTRRLRCRRCGGTDGRVAQVSRGTLFLPSWVRGGNAGEDAMTFVTCTGCGEQWYNNGWVCF